MKSYLKSIIALVLITTLALCNFCVPVFAAYVGIGNYQIPQGPNLFLKEPIVNNIVTNSQNISFCLYTYGIQNLDDADMNIMYFDYDCVNSHASTQVLADYGDYKMQIVNLYLWREGEYTFHYSAGGASVDINLTYTNSVFIIQNDRFHKVNVATGEWEVLGQPEWSGPSFATTLYQTGTFVVNNDTLHSVNQRTGAWSVIGEIGEFANVTAMTGTKNNPGCSMYSDIYIVQDSNLYRVNKFSGDRQFLSSSWDGPTEMTSIGEVLYIVNSNTLHRVNRYTGAWEVIGNIGDWADTTAITSAGDYLFIVKDSNIYKVDSITGTSQVLSTDWSGPTEIVSEGCILYAVNNNTLHNVDINTGEWQVLGSVGDWADTKAMAN